jgi:HEAT repeat protein
MLSFTPQDIQQARLLLRESNVEDDIVAALDILGALKVIDAVPDMMRHINDDRPDVKVALEAALLAMGQDAIPAIVEYLPKLDPEQHISLQSLVETYWKDAGVDKIRQMMNHEDNRVRWAMAWTLAKPLRTIPPENIAYIFEGLEDESLTAIRWAATQSLTTLAYTSDSIPPELIKVALPVMVDNFKYGDVNLSETSVQAIALLTSPPHPAITAMLTASDAELQVAAVKVLTAWVHGGKELDNDTLDSLKTAIKSGNWQMTNEVSRLRYGLGLSFPETLKLLEDVPDTGDFDDDDLEPTQDIRATGEIMLPPLDKSSDTDDEK